MAPKYKNPYAFDCEVRADGSVAFACSQDMVANPWLNLRPHHAVVIQTQAFWTAVGAGAALAEQEESRWTALTEIDWTLGSKSNGHAVSGIYRRHEAEDRLAYEITLLDASSEPTVSLSGQGVIFRNRDFEKWRESSKEKARAAAHSGDFTFADRNALGLTPHERSLIAPYNPKDGWIEALVTLENGLPPGNPVIGGSGDHVNSTHMHELARQALCLINGRSDLDASGTMSLKRYVELGTPLRLNIRELSQSMASFEVEQLDKICAEVTLRW